MRYVPGTDLRSLVKRRRPARAGTGGRDRARGSARRSTPSTTPATSIATSSPRTCSISRHGHVYLGDLGIAKDALAPDMTTGPDHWVGTVDFAAPEQIRGGPVDGRADVYALGGVLFFMLYGPRAVRARLATRRGCGRSSPSRRRSRRRCARGCRSRSTRSWRARSRRTRHERPASAGRARPRGAGRAVGRPDGRRAAAIAPGAPAPARRRRARGRRGPRGRRGGGLALLSPDAPDERASTAPRSAGPSPPAGPSAGASTRGIGYRPREHRGRRTVPSGCSASPRATSPGSIPRRSSESGRQPRIGQEAMSVAGRGATSGSRSRAAGRCSGWTPRAAASQDRITPPQTPVDVELGDDGAVWVTARRPMKPYDPLRPHDLVLRYDRDGAERARISGPARGRRHRAGARRGLDLGQPQAPRCGASTPPVGSSGPRRSRRPPSRRRFGAGAPWGSTATADAVGARAGARRPRSPTPWRRRRARSPSPAGTCSSRPPPTTSSTCSTRGRARSQGRPAPGGSQPLRRGLRRRPRVRGREGRRQRHADRSLSSSSGVTTPSASARRASSGPLLVLRHLRRRSRTSRTAATACPSPCRARARARRRSPGSTPARPRRGPGGRARPGRASAPASPPPRRLAGRRCASPSSGAGRRGDERELRPARADDVARTGAGAARAAARR